MYLVLPSPLHLY
nr:unnamed protein product [Callosobruchus chinensis]